MGAVASSDGRYLYYAERRRDFSYNSMFPLWQIKRKDRKTGDIRWQRVVLANQKVVIQSYLHRHYPPKGDNNTPPKDPRKKPVAA